MHKLPLSTSGNVVWYCFHIVSHEYLQKVQSEYSVLKVDKFNQQMRVNQRAYLL